MVLNEFLQLKLGVKFENKYNSLAVAEILDHKDQYPLIAENVENSVEIAACQNGKWDYDSDFFDCDDELCAGYEEVMELYHAFLRAFAENIRGKPVAMKLLTFGVDYLRRPDVRGIVDPFCCHFGASYISLSAQNTEIGETIFYPAEYGNASTERYSHTFSADHKETLKNVTRDLKQFLGYDGFSGNRIDNADLKKKAVTLPNGEVGYPCDIYRLQIGKNFLRLFSTERGFDALSVFRFPIFEALTGEQRQNEIVKKIETLC